MKEVYEKPAMATEDVDIGELVANGGSPVPDGAVLIAPCIPCD
jgi:hypothetical protein